MLSPGQTSQGAISEGKKKKMDNLLGCKTYLQKRKEKKLSGTMPTIKAIQQK